VAGPWQGYVEHQDGAGLHLGNAGRRLAELDAPLPAEEFLLLIVHEPDPEIVAADLGSLAPHPDHQVGARVHGGKLLDPDVLEDAQHGKLAVLVDQGVVGEDREIDVQVRSPGSR
jgi:hypothetical protein